MTCMQVLSAALLAALVGARYGGAALPEGVAQGSYSRGSVNAGGAPAADQPQPYSFEYAVQDAESGNDYGQRESGDGAGGVQGEYHVLLPDGRRQVVTYSASDAAGFTAEVTYDGEAAGGGARPSPLAPVARPGAAGGGATSPVYLPPSGK